MDRRYDGAAVAGYGTYVYIGVNGISRNSPPRPSRSRVRGKEGCPMSTVAIVFIALGVVLLLVVAILFLTQLPELRRYLRMRAM